MTGDPIRTEYMRLALLLREHDAGVPDDRLMRDARELILANRKFQDPRVYGEPRNAIVQRANDVLEPYGLRVSWMAGLVIVLPNREPWRIPS